MSEQIIGVNTEGTPPVLDNTPSDAQPTVTATGDQAGLEKEGLIKALQDERQKAAMEEHKANYFRKLYEESNALTQQPQLPQQPQQDEFNFDEVADLKTVDKLVNSRVNEALAQIQEQQRATQAAAMAVEAQRKYPDFTEVINNLGVLMESRQVDQAYGIAIMNASNPAEMAYKLGKLHLDSNKNEKGGQSTQAILDAIQGNAAKPPTLSTVPSSGTVYPAEGHYKNMPEAEWKKHLEDLRARA